jgi:lipopolysaccharide transport system ATP-binding protein
MSDAIITVENLGKKYEIVHQQGGRGGRTLRETLNNAATGLVRGLIPNGKRRLACEGNGPPRREEFWALRNVSFEVKQGEVLGIIGRNGAGKSTLLKVLSRITEPTEGRVRIRGRVASLLEVGTGFHPELTGRENIYLNGAILGMGRQEIRKKFEEIVDFAGTEKFLDTPVKRYSSGMYVRLAFAVAAHLEPEILVVDEVLSVGDAEFQKKCLGKMEDVSSKEGRTVLFVSHNMETVDRLTSRCMLLRSGVAERMGPTSEVVSEYLLLAEKVGAEISEFRQHRIPRTVSIRQVWTEGMSGEERSTFRQGEPFRIRVCVDSLGTCTFDLSLVIENSREQALFTTHMSDFGAPITREGAFTFAVEPPSRILRAGNYKVSMAAFSPDKIQQFDLVVHVPLFMVAGTVDHSIPDDSRWGNLYFPIEWKSENGQ